MLPKVFQVMGHYAEGKSFKEIQQKMGLDHDTQVRRLMKEGCQIVLTFLQHNSEGIVVSNHSKKDMSDTKHIA